MARFPAACALLVFMPMAGLAAAKAGTATAVSIEISQGTFDGTGFDATTRNPDLGKRYHAALAEAVRRIWPDMGQEESTSCEMHLRQLPGGTVLGVDFGPACGFSSQLKAEIYKAIQRTSPLPYPGYEAVFNRLLTVRITVGRDAHSTESHTSPGQNGYFDPVIVYRVTPVYPDRAAAQGIGGTVRVELTVGEDGKVKAVQILKSSRQESLDAAACEACLQWMFQPAMLDGKAVESRWTDELVFVPPSL